MLRGSGSGSCRFQNSPVSRIQISESRSAGLVLFRFVVCCSALNPKPEQSRICLGSGIIRHRFRRSVDSKRQLQPPAEEKAASKLKKKSLFCLWAFMLVDSNLLMGQRPTISKRAEPADGPTPSARAAVRNVRMGSPSPVYHQIVVARRCAVAGG